MKKHQKSEETDWIDLGFKFSVFMVISAAIVFIIVILALRNDDSVTKLKSQQQVRASTSSSTDQVDGEAYEPPSPDPPALDETKTSASASRSTSRPSSGNCDPNYSPCVPKVSGDLDCPDIGFSVTVIGSDPHRFDRDGDGYGCESY